MRQEWSGLRTNLHHILSFSSKFVGILSKASVNLPKTVTRVSFCLMILNEVHVEWVTYCNPS